MIQRIQSIYLLLAGGAAFGTFGLPFASTDTAQTNSALFADSVFNNMDSIAVLGSLVGAGAVMLITIFLFNNRKLQMNLTKFGLFLAGVATGAGAYALGTDAALQKANPQLGLVLLVLVLLFGMLAFRAIKKDEALVRSVDRLR